MAPSVCLEGVSSLLSNWSMRGESIVRTEHEEDFQLDFFSSVTEFSENWPLLPIECVHNHVPEQLTYVKGAQLKLPRWSVFH